MKPLSSSFFVLICFFVALSYSKIQDHERSSRFFPWSVGLVRFQNGVCVGKDNLLGTCYTRRQCAEVDGVSNGRCANGIGVCCVVQKTCGETSSQNNTYFVSPGFPSGFKGTGSCTLTIEKCSSDICQIRIDLLTFNSAQPNADGVCITDALQVIGGASTVPIICGENSGQHMYVDFNKDSDIQIVVNKNSLDSLTTAWNIKVAQIGCNCPTKAPSGCLMYYTAPTGTVKSFNFGITGSPIGTRQLVAQNYGVCIAMQPGFCSIQWSQSGGNIYTFTVSNDTNAAVADATIGTPAASILGTNCTTDFVVIPDPVFTNGTTSNSDRFCGNGFPTVTSSSKPFVLTVVTNGNEVGDVSNRGFSLQYSQQRCTNSLLG